MRRRKTLEVILIAAALLGLVALSDCCAPPSEPFFEKQYRP